MIKIFLLIFNKFYFYVKFGVNDFLGENLGKGV